MGLKVAMFMHRAALNQDIRPECRKRFLKARRAIDDHELRDF
jgi:hypothetical protein